VLVLPLVHSVGRVVLAPAWNFFGTGFNVLSADRQSSFGGDQHFFPRGPNEKISNNLVARPATHTTFDHTDSSGLAFRDIPVIVLSAGIQDWEEDPKLSQDHALKLNLQQKMAALSSRGSQRISAIADTGFHSTRPVLLSAQYKK
jgi:hypothetical protein